jgi:hypothetical protein
LRNRPSLLARLWLAPLVALCCAQPVATAQDSIQLTDVSDRTGIQFVHTDGSDGRYFVIESFSAGLALLDYDLDGDLDIYFLNGAAIDRPAGDDAPTNALYRNDGDWRFTDVTRQAGVGDTGFGMGVACGDFNNDGAPDIYVNNYGSNVLYRNNADGTFADVTASAQVGNGHKVGAGVSYLDMDADGDLDLYVANYCQFDPAGHKVHIHKGLPAYPSVSSAQPEPDTLFRNNSDDTFTDVSDESGIRSVAGRSMGVVAFDYDQDGDSDIAVANDTMENHLFQNDGHGQFTEVALRAGFAYDYKGRAQGSMGLEVADFDGDGLQDVYVTSFSEEFATLYRNLGGGLFEDATLRSGGAQATLPHVTWGVVAEDFDNNGTRDLLIAAGDIDDKRHLRGGASSATAFKIPNILLANVGQGKLRPLQRWGSGSLARESSRGMVAGDLDSDGRIDAVVLNGRAAPTILKNESKPAAYVQIRLVGTTSNREGVGAKVTVEQGEFRQTREVLCGHSYQSDSGRMQYFGLPSPATAVSAKIVWPTGKTQLIKNVPIRGVTTVVETNVND